MSGLLVPALAVAWDIQFSHQGLADATLWLTLLTTATGLTLLWFRYGGTARGLLVSAVRWGHVVLGLGMLVYLLATYWIVPV